MSLLNVLGLKARAVVNDNRAQVTASRLAQKMQQGAFDEVESQFASATGEVRERLFYGCACDDNSVASALAWTQARPRSSLAHTALGASYVVSGWKIRGTAYADGVDSDAWRPFFDSLALAETALLKAASLDESSADPYAWLIHAEMGRSGERATIDEYFRVATARVPLHWAVHYKYFSAVAEKWGGSHQDMFAFARATSRQAPKGSTLHCLVAAAFCEYALAENEQAVQALRHRDKAAEVAAALYAWAGTDKEGLADKLADMSGGFVDYGLNHFAVACYLCGANEECRAVLAALGGEIETVPWAWISNGVRERLDFGFVHDRVQRAVRAA